MAGAYEAEREMARLFEAHHVALTAYCRRRIASHMVPDALSEVYLAAWRRISDLPTGKELPWLYGIARLVVQNHRRGVRRQFRLRSRLERLLPPQMADTETQVVRRAEERIVLEALSTLRQTDQEILRLRAWEELTTAEIASVLGITESAAEMRLTRAKRRLERALKSAGYVDSSLIPARHRQERGQS